ncbi:hypothetical protein [uncultured Polaribacter sp.]|uniref:alpha/beta hydrolase n=1 Tax=uncultured Polaribacter sp. TaxID=174711 RepID=UPI00259B2874|nr:hypothetical protein [uncultured Polaribacter sp.]
MKKILLVTTLLLINLTLKSQVTTSIEVINDVDVLIENIDKSTFTSNILYDRVVPSASLTDFNATNNTSNLLHFEQSLSELYRASKKTKFTSVDNVRKKYQPITSKNKVTIGVLNTIFHQVNYDDNDNNNGALKISNNKLVPINQKPLFIENEALIIAPLKKNAEGTSITYYFEDDLIFEETTKKIIKLTANLNSQQVHTIINNSQLIKQNVIVNYNSSGYKTLTFTVTFNDGTIKTTKGKFYVTVPNINYAQRSNDGIEDGSITATIPFTGYEPGDLPILGQLEYRIFYHGTPNNYERTLKKPIVIIDGFDPFDTRKIQESDYPNDGEDHPDAIETLMTYKDGAEDIPLISQLREQGFDVVIVNHPVYEDDSTGKVIDGGADYIERNAMAHIALYQYLNNTTFNNGSSEELIIMGPSMGGQISRYALAYMEENNLNHNTKLWVSIDSPHLGANIPMATQANLYFLGYIHGNQEAKDKYDFLLNSPAGKQQLILQYSHNSTSLPPYFQQYHNNLESNLPNFKGFPQIPRNIAISNGSLNKGINYAGQKVLDIRGFVDVLWFSVKGFQNEQWFIKNTGQTNKIYFGKVDKVFSGYSMSATFTNPLIYGALDALQGGMADSQGELKVEMENALEDEVDRVHIYEYKPNHAFIPTVSSLAFKNPNFNWRDNIDRDLTCTNEIPFKTYYAPKNNEDHIYFTVDSYNWLLQELLGNEQEPVIYLTDRELTGDLTICSNKTNTYSINVPSSCVGNINWSVSSNIQILSQNYNTITVAPKSGNIENAGFVSVSIPNADIEKTKGVWVGLPNNSMLSIQKIGSYNFYSGQWTKLKAVYPILMYDVNEPFDLTFEWQIPNSQVRNYTDTAYKDVKPNYSGQLNIGVKVANECGCSDWKYQAFQVIYGGSSGGGPIDLIKLK